MKALIELIFPEDRVDSDTLARINVEYPHNEPPPTSGKVLRRGRTNRRTYTKPYKESLGPYHVE